MAYPTPMAIPPQSSTHTHTLILLHGRGDTATDFGSELLASSRLPFRLPTVKFVFPTARERRAVILGRIPINQWFDNYSLEDPGERTEIQVEGLCQTGKFLRELIDSEAAELGGGNRDKGYDRVILGGLSQGCAMGMFAFLAGDDRASKRLGGFVGMSGWLPFNRKLEEIFQPPLPSLDEVLAQGEHERTKTSPPLKAIDYVRDILDLPPLSRVLPDTGETPTHLQAPVFLGHGSADEVVSMKLGEEMAGFLVQRLQMDVTWRVYEGFGHWYKTPDEIDDIILFLEDLGVPVVVSDDWKRKE